MGYTWWGISGNGQGLDFGSFTGEMENEGRYNHFT